MADNITLKEYFEKLIAEQEKRFNELRKADQLAVSAALTAAKEAVGVAEANAEKWRANANEWRGAMTDREKNFMPRSEFDASVKGLRENMLDLQKRADRDEGKNSGQYRMWLIILGLVSIASLIFGIIK